MKSQQAKNHHGKKGTFFYPFIYIGLCSCLALFSAFETKNTPITSTRLSNSKVSLNQIRKPMITHTVFFRLKHPTGSAEEKNFFVAVAKLASILGVQQFELVKQLSTKNKFSYGLTMQFASQTLYTAYTNHPDHTQFVKTYWEANVADFMEIDYMTL